MNFKMGFNDSAEWSFSIFKFALEFWMLLSHEAWTYLMFLNNFIDSASWNLNIWTFPVAFQWFCFIKLKNHKMSSELFYNISIFLKQFQWFCVMKLEHDRFSQIVSRICIMKLKNLAICTGIAYDSESWSLQMLEFHIEFLWFCVMNL